MIPISVREKLSKSALQWAPSVDRVKQGMSLNDAERLILVYLDSDEEKFKLVRDIAQFIKLEYRVKRIMRMAFIPHDSKSIPAWHLRKLESDYFCKSDLNLLGKPVRNVHAHLHEPYDILVNLDPDSAMPLDYFIALSKARLKVSNQSEHRPKDYDILLPPVAGDSWKQRNHRIIKFLSEASLS